MIRVRQALLTDAIAIGEVYRSTLPETLAYDELSLYEQWMLGGPWYALTTCAVWIGHLLQSDTTIPLVAEHDGQIIAEAEVFIGREPTPYGYHINISTLYIHHEAPFAETVRAVVGYIEEMAAALGCQNITIAYPQDADLYTELGFAKRIERYEVSIAAEEGRVFYKAQPLADDNPAQIDEWHMGMGRYQNAREEWERMFWYIWKGVPQLVQAQWHRLKIDITGQPTVLHLHQHSDQPGHAAARVWTKHALSSHVVSAVRDRAARLGYKTVTTLIEAPHQPLFREGLVNENPHWLWVKDLTK